MKFGLFTNVAQKRKPFESWMDEFEKYIKIKLYLVDSIQKSAKFGVETQNFQSY